MISQYQNSHQIYDFSVPDIPADNVKIILAVVKYQNKVHCNIDTNQKPLQCHHVIRGAAYTCYYGYT
mgnify:FL=1